MSYDVCISYSSKDRERILRMAQQLRDAGVSVWIDQGGIDAAALWTAEIVKAIDGCKVLLLALSAAAAESPNVVKEVSLALDRKKHILPVNLEPVEVPVALRYPLAGIQHVDLFGDKAQENFATVVRALARLGVPTSNAPAAAPAAARTPRKALNDKVIAVLPFVNISPDKESDYFSDGLTEDLISNLSRLKEMSVVSRTNSIRYKGSKLDIEEIGRELGARYIIEGTVRRHQEDLRITANLIDVESSTQLWSDRYKGKMADVFDIQETVSKEIVDALVDHAHSDREGGADAALDQQPRGLRPLPARSRGAVPAQPRPTSSSRHSCSSRRSFSTAATRRPMRDSPRPMRRAACITSATMCCSTRRSSRASRR